MPKESYGHNNMGATETKLLGKIRRRIGDNNSSAYIYQDSELWLWLRDSIESVAKDLVEIWEPSDITADSDFTASPAITNDVGELIVLKGVEIIAKYEWHKMEQDGVGTNWKGGMDQLDTRDLVRQAKERYKEAKRDYEFSLDDVTTNETMYKDRDLYSDSISDNVEVN